MLQLILIFLLGCGAGFLSGIFGIGGGLVIVPGLVYLFKYEPRSAVATSLGALLIAGWPVCGIAISSSWIGRLESRSRARRWHPHVFVGQRPHRDRHSVAKLAPKSLRSAINRGRVEVFL